MNYIGSKNKLSSWILEVVENTIQQPLSQLVFCDLFAGTGIVGRTFKPLVKQVIANDIEFYSFVLLKNYIENHREIPYAENYIQQLNELETKKGFIAEEYGENGKADRLFFSKKNAEKIDACRQQIETWKASTEISENLYYFLLASLLESADKVANTASVYGAFLKKIKTSAAKELVIQPAGFVKTKNTHQVFQEDANKLIQQIEGDILYLDPPYNARQYGANYHLLTTIAKYDTFAPKGKTGLRGYYKSVYCKKKEVAIEFEELIKQAKFSYIFLSYNNEGLMPPEVIQTIMSKYGKYSLASKNYQRFKADKTENRNHKANQTIEYLHILEK
ncbi:MULTISPECIES: DNA adenine methylase [Mesonia]|uniref:Modification methylase FokI n=1 Tax=Mesonia oceanica TaxID=2687242 RepID=A0AC61Y1P5_9FLAO|nr:MULTISPECIES: DNA adenine methylase [Mesonia]MAN28504.1 modification methylase [Mesonia sp.]MAQ41185.1 modification methylase [Mesonia sp.]MBJ97283.1 modification methylase [Flavobacteriaceae bacterium]VVU98758.1 Modification methylase FokI [Mesonia oceanica]|tara:strand:+ start:92170 stop:93168 length:999 start_codon:yes stop_codon:yes gene_type:complete